MTYCTYIYLPSFLPSYLPTYVPTHRPTYTSIFLSIYIPLHISIYTTIHHVRVHVCTLHIFIHTCSLRVYITYIHSSHLHDCIISVWAGPNPMIIHISFLSVKRMLQKEVNVLIIEDTVVDGRGHTQWNTSLAPVNIIRSRQMSSGMSK